MAKELVLESKIKTITITSIYFKTINKNEPININEIDTDKIVLSDKISYGEHGFNKYYIGYLSDSFKPLYITIKNIKLYTNYMNVLANDNELLKYIEIWNKIETLFNKKFNKKGFHSKHIYNN